MTNSPKSGVTIKSCVLFKCPKCSGVTGVDTYQIAYDQALKRIERLSIALERIRDNCESSYKWIESECTKALAEIGAAQEVKE